MARLLDELRTFLEASYSGPTYQALQLQDSPDRAVAIRPGPGAGSDLDAPLIQPTVQLLVRGPATPFYQAHDDAWALFGLFNDARGGGRNDFTLATLRVLWAVPQPPIPLGKDATGRWLYSVNVRMKLQRP